MAQTPDVAPDPVEGQTLPPAAVAPTDFGLERAGQTLESVAMMSRRTGMLQVRVQAAQDKQAALTSPQWQAFGEADARGFAGDAANWDPTKPGFAADQIDKVKSRLDEAAAAYAAAGATPGQVSEFRMAGTQAAAQRGAQANDFEQRQLMAQAATAQDTALNGLKTQAITAWSPAKQQLYDGYDGSTPSLVPQAAAGFDAATAPILAAAPANLQPRLQLELSLMKEQAVAEAAEQQGHVQAAYVFGNAGKQATSLINTVGTNPLAYDQVMEQLPQIAATLPADVRDKALAEFKDQTAEARVHGLIAQRNGGQALSEISDGRYNFLPPDRLTALRDAAIADNRANGPEAEARGAAQWSLQQRIEADQANRAQGGPGILAPGELDAGVKAGVISAEEAGRYQAQAAAITAKAAAAQPVFTMTNAQLAAVPTEPRPPAEDVAGNQAYDARQKVAAEEAKARAEPGRWAWSSEGQKIDGQPMGPALQKLWGAAVQAPPGPQRAAAMSAYVSQMMGVQHQAGFGPGQMQVVPKETVAALAQAVEQAAPDQKLAQMQNLAAVVDALPTRSTAPDGAEVNPRAIFGRQLADKGALSAIEASAIADFRDNPAAMGRVVSALNNTGLKATPTPRGDTTAAQVRTALAPYLATDPESPELTAGRIQRTILVARNLEAGGMQAEAAAGAAARDLTGEYSFMGGWRMPAAQAAAPVTLPTSLATKGAIAAGALALGPAGLGLAPLLAGVGQVRGDRAVAIGAGQILSKLTANAGANLYAPPTLAGDLAHRQAFHAQQVMANGRWQTLPDDSGLALTLPTADGRTVFVQDQYGRPVQATWAQAQGVAMGHASPFDAPPPRPAVTTPAGAPVRAASPQEVLGVLSPLVEHHESRGVNGLTSSTGAVGVMQLMPSTVQTYAAKLGLPADVERARTDPAYNRTLANAYLGDLLTHFMTGAHPMAGIPLALAAYSAGQGRLEGFTDKRTGQYHPGWLATLGDPRSGNVDADSWASRIPFKETRDYVRQVAPQALSPFGASF